MNRASIHEAGAVGPTTSSAQRGFGFSARVAADEPSMVSGRACACLAHSYVAPQEPRVVSVLSGGERLRVIDRTRARPKFGRLRLSAICPPGLTSYGGR